MKAQTKETKSTNGPLVKIGKNRYVDLFMVDRLNKYQYIGHGRPKQSAYSISDISPVTRRILVAMKRAYLNRKVTAEDSKKIYVPFNLLRTIFVVSALVGLMATFMVDLPRPNIVSPLGGKAEAREVITKKEDNEPTEENIKRYIAIKFGFDAPKAWGVLRAESNRSWKPGNNLVTDAVFRTPYECSVGLFQINLADGHCDGTWVHAYKIPGETIEQKVEWLKDWRNNIDTAYKIYKVQGFKPWSTYQDGRFTWYTREF